MARRAQEEAEFRAKIQRVVQFITRIGASVESTFLKIFKRRPRAQSTPTFAADVKAPVFIPAPIVEPIRAGKEDTAVVGMVNKMIAEAYARGASDIHVEPRQNRSVQVRCRIDGVIKNIMEFPWQYHRAIISRIKVMAVLDIAEHRKPQSGKIRFSTLSGAEIELRVEIYPTIGDIEDASMRLLVSAERRPLESLDFTPRNLTLMKTVLQRPSGLFLCVGPSGSGKTTTLHGALSHINDQCIKILTAEDPVEITQVGIRQLQINRRAGVTFAEVLRSFLRCDPDVIMIGEMRDCETASIALEAGLTGHLVFSTLHTNSAVETINRMLEMGLDAYSFSDALQAVLSQRLLRTLCPACHQVARNKDSLLSALRSEYGSAEQFDELLRDEYAQLREPRQGECFVCDGDGYRGRAAIHELLVLNDEMRRLIVEKSTVARIREAAVASGMRTLKQDGIEKVLRGRTSLTEVNMVCMR